jgi:hypothetical protein
MIRVTETRNLQWDKADCVVVQDKKGKLHRSQFTREIHSAERLYAVKES